MLRTPPLICFMDGKNQPGFVRRLFVEYFWCCNGDRPYKKRWKVEVFHKSLKSNASLAKSPTRTLRTQSNHVFMAITEVMDAAR